MSTNKNKILKEIELHEARLGELIKSGQVKVYRVEPKTIRHFVLAKTSADALLFAEKELEKLEYLEEWSAVEIPVETMDEDDYAIPACEEAVTLGDLLQKHDLKLGVLSSIYPQDLVKA